MTNRQDNPDIPDVIGEVIRAETARIRTVIPGKVVAYDHAEQRADVRPKIRSSYRDPDTDERETYLPQIIRNCPVSFPQGGGFSLTFPLAEGDPVELHFASRSLDEWLAGGGDDVTPEDVRRHDLTDAIVHPGIRSFANALGSDRIDEGALVIFGHEIHLGSAGLGSSKLVALASKVESELSSLRTQIQNHTHNVVVNGSAAPTGSGDATLATTPAPTITPVGDVSADKVKAE